MYEQQAPQRVELFEDDLDVWTLLLALGFMAVLLVGVLLLMQPQWMMGIRTSLVGSEPKAPWYLARATAFVAFSLVWLSMVLGLSITNKLARLWPGGPTALDLHQYTSLLGLAFGSFHALILSLDRYIGYTLRQVLVPFGSVNYRPFWVGLGQIGLYLAIVVALSFYVRRFIGYRLWRAIHFASFALFVLVLVHALMSGTDSPSSWARGLYLFSGASVLGLTLYRVQVARRRSIPAPAR